MVQLHAGRSAGGGAGRRLGLRAGRLAGFLVFTHCGRLVLPVLLSRLDETDDLHELLARLVPLVLLPLVVRAGGVGAGRLSGPLAMALSGGAGPVVGARPPPPVPRPLPVPPAPVFPVGGPAPVRVARPAVASPGLGTLAMLVVSVALVAVSFVVFVAALSSLELFFPGIGCLPVPVQRVAQQRDGVVGRGGVRGRGGGRGGR